MTPKAVLLLSAPLPRSTTTKPHPRKIIMAMRAGHESGVSNTSHSPGCRDFPRIRRITLRSCCDVTGARVLKELRYCRARSLVMWLPPSAPPRIFKMSSSRWLTRVDVRCTRRSRTCPRCSVHSLTTRKATASAKPGAAVLGADDDDAAVAGVGGVVDADVAVVVAVVVSADDDDVDGDADDAADAVVVGGGALVVFADDDDDGVVGAAVVAACCKASVSGKTSMIAPN